MPPSSQTCSTRKARSERKDNLKVRTLLEDPYGQLDKFVNVIQTTLDEGWWLVYVSSNLENTGVDPSFNGAPIEIITRWTAGTGGGIGNQFIATVSNSEVFAIYATNLTIDARNTSFDKLAGCNVNCCPVINHVPSVMMYDEPFDADANQIVLVPRFATKFRVEIDNPALIGTVTVQIISGSDVAGPLVTFNLADQPDDGWWIGNCKYLFIVFTAALCRYRVVFTVEV